MRKESLEFLERLINTPSPCSQEMAGQRVWMDYVSPMADETFSDDYGNCVAIMNKGRGPRIMLAAHADEIAMSVNYIDESGFIFVRKVGGINAEIIRGQRAVVHTPSGTVSGVFGCVAPHMKRGESTPAPPKIHELFLDIGADSKEEALKRIRIGDLITLDQTFQKLNGDLVVGRALDNRTGTFSVAEAFRQLTEFKSEITAEVCAVSNVMEEIGLFGARQIAHSLEPDAAIVTDVTHATDYPSVDKAKHGDIKLGSGPTLTRRGCNHPIVVQRLEAAAKSAEIELQYEATSNTTGTDTDAIFWTRGGIPSALISLPNRYMHSPVEMVHLQDLEAIPRLMAEFVKAVQKDDTFKVII